MTVTDQARPADPGPDPRPAPGEGPGEVLVGVPGRPWYRRRRVLAVVVAVLLVAAAAVVGWRVQVAQAREAVRVAAAAEEAARVAAAAEAERLDVLAEAVTGCYLDAQEGVELVDGDRSLLIDTAGQDQIIDALIAGTTATGATLEDLGCVLGQTGAPQAVIAEMNATRALDGRRTGSWDDITASWSYHPDTGMDLVLTVE